MALITCPECGREISDKAVACPGCGFPVDNYAQSDNRSELDKLVDDIWLRNPVQRVNAIKELQKATGMSLKEAKEAMDIKYDSQEGKLIKANVRAIEKERQKQNREDLKNAFSALANLSGKDKTSRCPKCRSTQITYGGNRPSIGRALVGGAVAGGAGAAIGGLTGKKGYAVCLNCGKRWKI